MSTPTTPPRSEETSAAATLAKRRSAPQGRIERELSELLVEVRGERTRTEVGKALGLSRLALTHMEQRGNLSLRRLQDAEAAYGVRFRIVAETPDGLVITPPRAEDEAGSDA